MKYLHAIYREKFLFFAAFFILLPTGFKLLCGVEGQIFLAHPSAVDPNFDHTVLYMMTHNIDGATALVLNKPYPKAKKSKIPAYLTQRKIPVFWGGPVHDETDIYVLEYHEGRKPKVTLFDSLASEDIDILDKIETSPEIYRVYMGASKWGLMQYEMECIYNIWVFGAKRDTVFPVIMPHPEMDNKNIWLKALQNSDFYKRPAIKGRTSA